MSKVLVTGSAGFIGGYVVEELLRREHEVNGVDDQSKYGPVTRSYDNHPAYRLIRGDARDVDLLTRLLADCTSSATARKSVTTHTVAISREASSPRWRVPRP